MKDFWKIAWKWIRYLTLFFFFSTILSVFTYRFINPPLTPLMVLRVFQQVTEGEKIMLKKDWVSLDKISPQLQLAVVASEDNRFLEHHGFDFEAIEKAKDYNEKKRGKKMRGASTISQQTAKNVFLWPKRSWIRKGLEAYFTVLIELVWSKQRIMEVYLNVIETGKGIYGAEKASQIYFNKPALKISPGEAALVAAILPNPLKWNPSRPTSFLLSRQQWILWNMGNIGKLEY
jgi:monofunctional biosynthetic peptidoglycan transglycosylase